MVSTCCEISPGWRFALFCGGELLESSIWSAEMSSFVHCSMMLQEVEKVLQSYLLPGSATMRNESLCLKKVAKVRAEVSYLRFKV